MVSIAIFYFGKKAVEVKTSEKLSSSKKYLFFLTIEMAH